jgi:hypothetical protein
MSDPGPKKVALRRIGWSLLAAALVVALLFLVVQPLRQEPEAAGEDVAAAWNRSIARLGIQPVFPPEEDFHVGDLWAVVVGAAEADTPILGKAVRIGHIDLRPQHERARNRQPVFADTASAEAGAPFRRQDRLETEAVPDGRIALTLAAFPGITIRHGERRSGSAAWPFAAFGATREALHAEEIRIPVAETWGVPAADAAGRLLEWCQLPDTRLYCNPVMVRRTLALALGDPRIAPGAPGHTVVEVALVLVNRVFLVREIEHRRVREASGALRGQAGAAPTATPPPEPGPADEGRARANLNAAEGALRAPPRAVSPANDAALRMSQTGSSEFVLRQVFQRPVVIGYRAVSFRLPPSPSDRETSR